MTDPFAFLGTPAAPVHGASDPFAFLSGPSVESVDPQRIRALIERYAAQSGVPVDIALNVARQESGFNPRARSSAGALGVMQLEPGTAQELGVNPLDPEQNIRGGLEYLAQQYRAFHNWPDALRAYNAGPNAVWSGRARNIPETRNYVAAILRGTRYENDGATFHGQPVEASLRPTVVSDPFSFLNGPASPAAPSMPTQSADPFSFLEGPSAAPTTVARTTPTAPPATAAPSGVFGGIERLIGGIGSSVGSAARTAVTDTLRALRVPQEALVSANLDFVLTHHRAPTLNEELQAATDAVNRDLSPSQVLRAHGLTHPGVAGTIEGLAADILADPMWFVTPAKVAEVLRIPEMLDAAKAARPVASLLEHPAVGRVARAVLNPDFGKSPEFVARRAQYEGEIRQAALDAQEFGQRIRAELNPDEDAVLRNYIEPPATFRPTKNPGNLVAARNAVLDEAKRRGLNVDKVQALGDEAIQRGLANDKRMLDLGVLDQKTFDEWAGQHVRRDYLKHADPKGFIQKLAATNPEAAALADEALKARAGLRGAKFPIAERLEFLSKRQDIPEDVRKALGEIVQGSYSIAKGEYLQGRSIVVRQFLTDAASTWGKDVAERGYARIPESERFGPLAGKWVPQAIADELIPAFGERKISAPWLRAAVSMWKLGKIGLNPAAHVRIMLHNLFLADIAGLGIFKANRYGTALRDLIQHGDWVREAERAGVFGKGALVEQDIFGDLLHGIGGLDDMNSTQALERGLRTYFGKAAGVLSAPARLAEHAMNFEDRLFKLAFYLDRRLAGVSIEDAARATNQALLDYRKVPSLVRSLSQYGLVPFLSFPFQATERVTQAVVEHPASLAKYGKIVRTVEDQSGATSQQISNEKSLLPPYLRIRKEGLVRLPVRDAQGRSLYFDLGYLLPVWIPAENIRAMLPFLTASGPTGNAAGPVNLLTGSLFSGGVVASLVNGLILGIDPLTGKPLAGTTPRPFGTKPVQNPLLARLTWLERFLAPPIVGTSAEGIYHAIRQSPSGALSRQPVIRSVPEALARYGAGLHLEHESPQVGRMIQLRDLQGEIQAVERDIASIAQSQYYRSNPAERDRAIQQDLDRIRTVVAQVTKVGSMSLPDDGVPPGPPINPNP
ncbi:MAG TPA: lytic transglycosylase domain-containing protein [Steroidobacteraceae bacterium]|nr:lytic transglycosylase domain-containing protein [Steroidobacteraceae bacterium]